MKGKLNSTMHLKASKIEFQNSDCNFRNIGWTIDKIKKVNALNCLLVCCKQPPTSQKQKSSIFQNYVLIKIKIKYDD